MRIAHVGNLGNVAYSIVKELRKRGIEADLFVNMYKNTTKTALPTHEDGSVPEWVYEWNMGPQWMLPFQARQKLKRYDIIHAYTVSPAYCQFASAPLFSHSTGSDLREMAVSNTVGGFFLRRAYRRSKVLFFTNPDTIKQVHQLKLTNAEYFPFCIDTDKYSPRKTALREKFSEQLLLFCGSRWDWNGKGTDMLLHGFAEIIGQKKSARLVMVDLGPKSHSYNRDKTLELIKELNLEKKITILPLLSKEQIIEWYNAADVVVDQFKLGSFGLSTAEAMSCAKSVMVYFDEEIGKECYHDMPPVLNAKTKEDIIEQISSAYDHKRELKKIGMKARDWMLKYHSPDALIPKLIRHYEDAVRK